MFPRSRPRMGPPTATIHSPPFRIGLRSLAAINFWLHNLTKWRRRDEAYGPDTEPSESHGDEAFPRRFSFFLAPASPSGTFRPPPAIELPTAIYFRPLWYAKSVCAGARPKCAELRDSIFLKDRPAVLVAVFSAPPWAGPGKCGVTAIEKEVPKARGPHRPGAPIAG